MMSLALYRRLLETPPPPWFTRDYRDVRPIGLNVDSAQKGWTINVSILRTMALGESLAYWDGLGTQRYWGFKNQEANEFFRVWELPVSSPLDRDGDGMDDVYELRHLSALNPLNPRVQTWITMWMAFLTAIECIGPGWRDFLQAPKSLPSGHSMAPRCSRLSMTVGCFPWRWPAAWLRRKYLVLS